MYFNANYPEDMESHVKMIACQGAIEERHLRKRLSEIKRERVAGDAVTCDEKS